MISEESKAVVERAHQIYRAELKDQLEQRHFGKFVSIEPLSGSYFLGDTFDEAVNAALDSYPDRLTYTLRVGHVAALHLGVLVQ